MFKHRVTSVVVTSPSNYFTYCLNPNGEMMLALPCSSDVVCLDLKESSVWHTEKRVSLTYRSDFNRDQLKRFTICDASFNTTYLKFHFIDETDSLMLVSYQDTDGKRLYSVLRGMLSHEGANIFWNQTATMGSLQSDDLDLFLTRQMSPRLERYYMVAQQTHGPDLLYYVDSTGIRSLVTVQRMEKTYDQIKCLDKVDYFETKILTDKGKVYLLAGVLYDCLLHSFDTKLGAHKFPLEVDGQSTKELIILERYDNFLFVHPQAYVEEGCVGFLNLSTLQWTRLNIIVKMGAVVVIRNSTLVTINEKNIIRYHLEHMPLDTTITGSEQDLQRLEQRETHDLPPGTNAAASS